MANYAKRRKISQGTPAQSESDDVNFDPFCVIPAGQEAVIFGLEAVVVTGSGAGDTIEVVASNAATTALCEVDINTTGVNRDSTTSFPVSVKNTGSTDIYLTFRTNGATGVSTDAEVFCDHSLPGRSTT